ncbi:hypothetical protein BDP27DRAFT_1421348 [Rhodocollybia butyracea]|uniref:SH3 domain-containing protein n=1 Tax=Rhodocollybia butyracea TaxID=206335 RepID=A0A9P5PTK7_9AGAR|nr:hypothetical protein BDP27DRAFT_1421348 [Rhodocollybia butyracea]
MNHGHLGRRVSVFREMKRQASVTSEVTSAASASLTTPTATSGTNSTAAAIVAGVPKSTVALAVILSLLVVGISALCIWRYRRRKQKKPVDDSDDALYRPTTNTSFDSEKQAGVEKPQKVFIPIPHKGEAAWTPQVKTYLGVPLKNGELPKHVQAAREGYKQTTAWRNEPSPPPSYQEKSQSVVPSVEITAPTNKPLSVLTNQPPSSRFSNPTPLLTTVSEHPEPLQSPARSASFANKQHRHSRSRSVSSKHISGEISTKVTPSQARHSRSASDKIRLMSVINTFHPSLDDELPIKIGDSVLLIEEYHDGWCLVQHVGKIESPRGVVPRFCLVDRATAPAKARKRSLTSSSAAKV